MKKLQKTWITDGLLDFEYKKYQLLAYLKHVNEHFQEKNSSLNCQIYSFITRKVWRYSNNKASGQTVFAANWWASTAKNGNSSTPVNSKPYNRWRK
ncbi:hypothetical protein [Siphonobacter sp. BAB-5385]|uniref:hypothetical protein n=1 Tax=Siphonobacter sp. BAB-5385 TaxID=1864822 RepID=UPI001595B508|nr:hypothetical protein [Siphonobacter sp. BAB-5385]